MKGEYNTGIIVLYDRVSGKKLRELKGHLTPIASMSFTPDSKTLVSRGVVFFGARFGEPGEAETKFVRFWDLATGKERKAALGGARPNGAVLAPDGHTLANMTMVGKTIALWDMTTSGQRGELVGHTDMVFDVAFSPDSRTVASASMDGTVRLWDPHAGKEIGRLEGHRGWVLALAFAPDGRTLISGGIDTTALVWDVSRYTRRAAAELTAQELETCWKDLGGDADIAYRAIGKMLFSPKGAVAILRQQLKPAPKANQERIAQLIGQLEDKQFKARDVAMKELEKLGHVAAPAVQKALQGNVPLEMKRRLELLLEKLEDAALPAETLRQVRAVEALQGIGAADAVELLRTLVAEGAPEARLTTEAAAALKQLQRR